MIVSISFIPSEDQIISGIPRFVEITSSSPATIFYTLNGVLPTMLSSVYTGSPISMPTDSAEITLSAVAYYDDGYGNLTPSTILSQIYSTELDQDRARYLFFDGISYIYPGGLDIPFRYDSDGNASVFIDIPFEDLNNELKVSDRNEDGSSRDKNYTKLSKEDTPNLWDDDYQIFDTPSAAGFNPEALFLLIDGRGGQDPNLPILINGPHMTLRNPLGNYRGSDFYKAGGGGTYRSGSLLKYHYDRNKGVMVFYYFDSVSNRWIKSIQNIPKLNSAVSAQPVISNPVVFKWFNWGRTQAV